VLGGDNNRISLSLSLSLSLCVCVCIQTLISVLLSAVGVTFIQSNHNHNHWPPASVVVSKSFTMSRCSSMLTDELVAVTLTLGQNSLGEG